MAKIRVYELAKKLNMTNKALLTKLKAMNIEAKSHMSSLEDDTEAQVRENMFGQKNKQADTRVKSSVIRRRRPTKNEVSSSGIKDKSETGKSEAKDESLVSPAPSPIPEIKSSKPEVFQEQASDVGQKSDGRQKTTPGKSPGDMPAKRSESKPKKKLRKTKSEPAKVILRPEQSVKPIQDVQKNVSGVKKDPKAEDAPMVEKALENLKKGEMEQSVKDVDADNVPEAKHEPAEKALEKEPQSKQEETALEAKKAHEKVLTPEVSPAEEGMDISDSPVDSPAEKPVDSSSQSTAESPAESKDKKRKKKKPQKRSEPAKIIKMAVPPPPCAGKNCGQKGTSTPPAPADQCSSKTNSGCTFPSSRPKIGYY